MTALAVAAAGAALALLVPSSPVRAPRALPTLRSAWALGVALVVAALLAWADGTTLALGLIGVATAAAAARLATAQRHRAEADRRAQKVLEVGEALAGELKAGQPPPVALRSCVELWDEIDVAVAAAELGADVPAALRRMADRRGADGLREVASAWQVAAGAGAGMAVALAQVAGTARERQAGQRVVRAELASAQATARLVAVLPVLVLLLGSGAGGDPWGFLLRSTAGLVCLATGLALAFAGLTWVDRIAAKAVTG